MPLVEFLSIREKVKLELVQGNDRQKEYKKFETVLNKNSRLINLTIEDHLNSRK